MEKNSIGKFIAALRKANGMTQQDVADRLNVSNKAVSRWERDECAPDVSVIPVLAEMFGITCDELLKGERNRDNSTVEKREAKVDKQVRNLINRTLSSFKNLIWISLTIAFVGLICMFGISYGFYRPVIGFAVMLLFEVSAAAVAVLAVSRTKDMKTDNELFEMADSMQVERFNRMLGERSFWAFYLVFSIIILSLPLILIRSDYVKSVITPYTYFTVFFGGIVMMLVLIGLKCRKPYMIWIAEGELPRKEKNEFSIRCARMTLVQIGLTVLAGTLFVIAPYFDTSRGEVSVGFTIVVILGLVCMAASIVFFGVFLVRQKEERKKFLLSGVRNIFMLPAAMIVAEMHSFGWRGVGGEDSFHIRCEFWYEEYLWYAIAYCLIVFIVFAFIDVFVNYKNNK